MKSERFIMVCCLVCAVSHVSARSYPWQQKALSNGMRIVVREDHRSPVVLSSIVYCVGSADETVAHAGISHMLEHMMFKNNARHEHHQNFLEFVANIGGISNAYTSSDVTGYWAKYPTGHFEDWLKLERDRMVKLTFKSKAFDKEKLVVMEERSMRVDNTFFGKLYEIFKQYAFVPGPYFTPTIGYASTIQHYQANDVIDWHDTYYQPQNAVMLIIGDVDHKKVFHAVNNIFGDVQNHRPIPQLTVDTHVKSNRHVVFYGKKQPELLMMGFDAPVVAQQHTSQDPYALSLLSHMLTDGDQALWIKRFRDEKRLVDDMGIIYNPFGRYQDAFVVWAVAAKGVALSSIEKAIKASILELTQQSISEAQLAMQKMRFESAFTFGQDDTNNVVQDLGQLLAGGYTLSTFYGQIKRINRVTVDQIQDVIKHYLLTDHTTTVYMHKRQ